MCEVSSLAGENLVGRSGVSWSVVECGGEQRTGAAGPGPGASLG